jgi:tetratricopeptide (TPR) repeat protein
MDLSNILIRKSTRDNKHPLFHEALTALSEDDFQRGCELLRRIGLEGESNAFIILGHLMELENNHPKLINYYLKASQMGNFVGFYHLGRFYFERGDLSQAREFFQEAYEEGVNQSFQYLKILEEKKNKEYFLFIALGPFFLFHKKLYEAVVWNLMLLTLISFINYKSLSILSFLLIFYTINIFFSESYDRSNS